MTWALFSLEGVQFIFRWIHLMAGVTWIGVLYYFNFIQGEFFKEADGGTKSICTQKLVPRALWWFRWGAMFTFFSGWIILGMKGHAAGFEIFSTSYGVAILTGAFLGSLMWANVWFVIWPAQKIIIQSATQVAQGGQAIAEAAQLAPKGALASRTNVMFSIPMLFFMGAASHLSLPIDFDTNLMLVLGAAWGIILLLEINGLRGKMGPLTTVKGVIHCGIALALVLYALMEVLA